MKTILFTKSLKGWSPEEIAAIANELEVSGLDLAIRPGHWVNPEEVAETLPRAMAIWKDQGLDVPLATLDTRAVDPTDGGVRAIFAACGQAGVSHIKLGYWTWKPGQSYWQEVEKIRTALEGFQELGRETGVCSLVHTHSHACYGCNASSAMHLVHGFDATHIGIYLDPYHLAVNGEDLPMALDIVRAYLKMVAVKNVVYESQPAGNRTAWRAVPSTLAEGLVDWPTALRLLKESGYSGRLSLHGEYRTEETGEVLRLIRTDAAYLKEALAALAA